MPNITNNLEDKYEEYLDLINVLCDAYDTLSKDILALPISAAIRVLVHDTKQSTSLLNHLNNKDIEYLSTNVKSPREPIHLGLVRRVNVGVTDGIGGEAKYWPLCDERFFPMPKQKEMLSFHEWWNDEVIFDSGISTLTRRDLVLSVANKDGGAHFDHKVSKKYDDFRHSFSGGSSLIGINSGNKRGYDNIPVYPAIRQIGYELICTLQPQQTNK